LNINVCTDIKVPYTDFYHTIRDYQRQKWQEKWNQQQYNKLKEIKPNIGKKSHHRLTRRDEVVLHRCRIGHSHLTHAYLLKNEDMPFCIPCDCPITIRHILVDCIDVKDIRKKYCKIKTLEELFRCVPYANIINFLKEIHLYYKI